MKHFCWLLLMLLGALSLEQVVRILPHPYPIEYGEGVNLLWVQRLETGRPLYPPVDPATLPQLHHPYPPLGAAATAVLRVAGLTGTPFVAGRLLSLTGILLAGVSIFRLVRSRAGVRPAWAALALFLLSPVVLRFGTMMRYDALALGLSLAAVALTDRSPTRARLFAAALLASCAVLTKPTFCAAAVLLLLRGLRRRHVWPVLLGGALPLLACLLWLFHRETPALWQHLVDLQGLPMDPGGSLRWLARFVAQHLWLCVGASLWFLPRGHSDADLRTYAVFALVPLLLTGAIQGSQENYALELLALSCVGAVCLWQERHPLHPRLAVLLLIAQALLYLPFQPVPVFTRTYGQEIPGSAGTSARLSVRDQEIGRKVVSELSSLPGPALSSDPGYLLAAHKEVLFQPYQFSRLVGWDLGALRQAIAETTFAVVLLKGDAALASDPMFPAGIQTLVLQHYQLHRVLGPWHLYINRDPTN